MTKPEEFRRLANVYVATTVVMVGILLVWNISLSLSLFKSHQSELAEHHIALVLSDQPDKIDLTTPQNRLVFSEDGMLTQDEQERISGSLQIPGTRWNVVILANDQLYSETFRSIMVQSMLIFVGFLLISLIMRMMLLDDQVK